MKRLIFLIFSAVFVLSVAISGCNKSKSISSDASLSSDFSKEQKDNINQIESLSENQEPTQQNIQLVHTNELYDPMEISPYTQKGTGSDRETYIIPMYYFYASGIESISDINTRNMIILYVEEAKDKMRAAAQIYAFRYNNIVFNVNIESINGYCIVDISCDLLKTTGSQKSSDNSSPEDTILDFMHDIAYFDLINNSQLSISDLFYKNEDFISIANNSITDTVFTNLLNYGRYGANGEDSINTFEGITQGCMYINVSTGKIYFPYKNPYFYNSKTFSIDRDKLCYNSIIWQPRDMKEKVNNQTMRLFDNKDFFKIINKKEITSCFADQEKIKSLNDKCRQLYNEKKNILQELIDSSPEQTDYYNSVYDTYKFNLLDFYSVDVDFYNKIIILKMYINDMDYFQFFIDYETEQELEPLEAVKKYVTSKNIKCTSTYDNCNEIFDQKNEIIDLTTDAVSDQSNIFTKIYPQLNENKTGLNVWISSISSNSSNCSYVSVYTEDYVEE